MFLTLSFTASEWRDEGLGSPRNAVVLPNRSETSQRLRAQGWRGVARGLWWKQEMKKPLTEHLRAQQVGLILERVMVCLLNQ